MARPATYIFEVAFTSSPDDPIGSQVWTNVSQYLDVADGVKITRGAADEQSDAQPAKLSLTLNNKDGRFTPNRASSPYYPNVIAGKYCRFSLVYAGVTYVRFTGKVNEFPNVWLGGPALMAEVKLTATDPAGSLGEGTSFQELIIEDVLDDHPFAFYPLTEPERSLTAGDVSGFGQGALAGANLGVPATSAIGFGSKYTAASSSAAAVERVPTFYRDTRTAAFFAPVDSNNGRYLTGQLAAPVPSTTGASVVAYARVPNPGLSTGPVAILMAADGSWFGLDKASSAGYTARFYNAKTGVLSEFASVDGPNEYVPSQMAAVLDIPSAGLARLKYYQDGVLKGTSASFTLAAIPNWIRVNIGGRPKVTFRGDISYVSFYDYPLTLGPIVAQWYSAFRGSDGTGDTTSSRVQKFSGFAGLGTVSILGTDPQSLGPQEIEGSPRDAIKLIEATEDGLFAFDGAGTPTMRLRNYRLNRAPDATITADMLDPNAVLFRGDRFGLTNDVTGTSLDGSTVRIVNGASVKQFGRFKDEIKTVSATDDSMKSLIAWKVFVDGQQRNRVTGVKVSLLNFSSIIASMLGLDLWKKLRITALPSQAPAATLDLSIVGWEETISEDDWSMAFNARPGDTFDSWQIGVAGHNEIGITTRIGY